VNRGLYLALLSLAGAFAGEPRFEPVEISYGSAVSWPKAVYVAFDALGRACYVGSVCRPEDRMAVSRRVRTHVLGRHRRSGWVYLHVFPLRPTTPDRVVRDVEGRIGRVLRPAGNLRLPGGLVAT
jgi:hypothetical protein